MNEAQAATFEVSDGLVVRACDFGSTIGTKFRYMTLPDLEPIEPTDLEGVYFIPGRRLHDRLREYDPKPARSE
jgi:hypothetical protein